jgi:phage terminase large subunit-like protein
VQADAWFSFVADLRRLLASLSTDDERRGVLQELDDDLQAKLAADWRYFARPSQLEAVRPPEGKSVVLALAGRGWGKTYTGANWVTEKVRYHGYRRVALVAETAADARDVMVEGESGILALSPPDFRPVYEPSKRRVTWPNGAVATTYAAESYDQLRGPNHDLAWVDELAKYRYDEEAWDQLAMTMRLPGRTPLTLVTTTPRPTKLVRELVADPDVHVIRGSTYDNAANLSGAFLARIEKRYAGTRLGRQELHAEVLDDVEGALWTWDQVREARLPMSSLTLDPSVREERGWRHAVLQALGVWRVVVAVDPAVSSNEGSDETGIVVVGVTRDLERAFVLDDRSGQYTANEWATVTKAAYDEWAADLVVAERNQGGDLVKSNLRTVDRTMNVSTVWAKRGKALRAEPVAGLYEQGRVRHLAAPRANHDSGTEVLSTLEDQMTSWVPGIGPSPDRVDALVYGLTELVLPEHKPSKGRTALV